MRRARAGSLLAALALAPLGLAGCVSEDVAESAQDVLTLRSGTMSGLRARRGQGPFHDYDVAPVEMLGVVASACGKAVGQRGRPVTVVELSTRYMEVYAKEQAHDAPRGASYGDEWISAVLVIVHPDAAHPDRSRVEWHATARSPLVGCSVDWQRVLPALIEQTLRERATAAGGAARGAPPP